MAKGQGGVEALTARATAAQAGHVGLGRGFVDEHQPFRPRSLLPDATAAALAADVGPASTEKRLDDSFEVPLAARIFEEINRFT